MPSILNSDDGVVSGTSGLKSTGGNDGLLNIQTNGSNAISISSGQRSTFPTTIGVGGATPSTSGSGISFPATQSASSDANTLDDYEQGTFDATITPVVSGTITLNSAYNRMAYTKIGRQVTITGLIIVSSVSSPVGTSVAIGNLPFPCSNIGELASRSSGAVTYRDDSASTYTVIPNQMVETLSQINCYMTAANIAANDEFVVGFTYFAAD